MNRYLLTLLLTCVSLYAQKNLNYAVGDIHTLTVPKGQLSISLSSYLMNDTVDVLDIKESELGNSTSYDSIGDLDGYGLKIRYGIKDDLMLHLSVTNHNIQYSSNSLKNQNIDTFIRFNAIQEQYAIFNSGISLDVGYVENKLEDFYLSDLAQLNDLARNIFGDSSLPIEQIEDNNDPILSLGDYYIPNLNTVDPNDKVKLDEKPWVALKDTSDQSYYLRILTGMHFKQSTLDFYTGVKKTKIKNLITANNDLISKATLQGYTIEQLLNRDETMYMAGFNYSYEKNRYIYEFGFEYDKFKRDSGLDYIDFNYIFDASVTKYINKNISIFAAGKIMYRQFNGQIPYLYNEYSQTSYDHKYGYAQAGIQFNF